MVDWTHLLLQQKEKVNLLHFFQENFKTFHILGDYQSKKLVFVVVNHKQGMYASSNQSPGSKSLIEEKED